MRAKSEKYSQREKEHKEQMEEIKTLHVQTKQAYKERMEAIQGNSRLLKDIENIAASGIKSSHKKTVKPTEDRDAIRKHYENQIERLNRHHKEETQTL